MASPCAPSTTGHFHALVLGVTPEYGVEVREDVLDEKDGPTLLHALQGVHGTELVLPTRTVQRPDTELLGQRYQMFRQAG